MAFTLAELSNLNAVSGNEKEAIEYIIPLINNKCDSIEVDSMGNIIALKKGKNSNFKILLGSNIDEVGFIVSDITDGGFVKFKAVGSIDPRTLISKRVRIGSGVMGVIGMKAIHLQKKEEREAAVKVSDLYIDIGAADKSEAEKRVKLGDYISFDTEFCDMGEIIKGKALDRFGTAALIYAMDETPAYDTYFVFSAQREIPCSIMGRGMKIAAYKINPDFALIVNTTDCCDFCGSKSKKAELGGGAIIEYMDRTSVNNVAFSKETEEIAKRNNIAVQKKTSSLGVSVSGAVTAASYGACVATVAIPCRYSHTPVVYMNKNDIKAVAELCSAFVRESDVVINGIIEKTDRN